jgi:hypothetical protein
MADKEDPQLPSQPSLQELCEKQSLLQISDLDNSEWDFASLEPRLQQLLFSRLQTENARLREVEQKWCQLTRKCPRIDTQIYLSSTRIEPGCGEDEENGYNQQGVFQDQWSYPIESAGSRAGSCGPGLVCDTEWDHSNLVSESPDSDLTLHYCLTTQCACWRMPRQNFSHRVSSQLVLYRLTVTFGMPPPKKGDGYKSCWEVDLQHCDGVSVLSFEDYKGAAEPRFHGTAEASVDALKLLNFLVGMNCPHTYDGIVAGTRA